jgi:hypothetical protein
MEPAMDAIPQSQRLFLARVATGLVQGIVLYLLYHAVDAQAWPATSRLLFAPLVLVWIYTPLILTLSLGEMPWAKAAVWTAIVAATLALLGWCDIWQAWPQDWVFWPKPHVAPTILPSAALFVFGGGGLFIAQALVIGGHQDQRFMARYPTHFDVAWKQAVQLALAALFTGAFWLLLWMGVNLFDLIKLGFFHRLIRHEWFSIPVVTLAAASGLHLTDIRPALVRGARTLLLALLSWLLPLITLIVSGFLASLPFTGLAPLFGFGHASGLLLIASAALIVLINAAHQDGTAQPPKILRLAGTLAAALPLPMVLIAGYALWLRVDQYGWTTGRVAVAACTVVALAYAGGYLRAAIARGPWLARIEQWNFTVSLLILVVLIALATPLASPLRIGIADQLARLQDGRTLPAKFDFQYLRREGGRYGLNALNQLAADGHDADFHARAREAAKTEPLYAQTAIAADMAARITVWPRGSKLPAGFAATDWSKVPVYERAGCMNSNSTQGCEAVLADLDRDGKPEVLLFSAGEWGIHVFHDNGKGWVAAGQMRQPEKCPAFLDALRQGKFDLVPPQPDWRELRVGTTRLGLVRSYVVERAPPCAH